MIDWRHPWQAIRIGAQLGVLGWILISLVACFPYLALSVPELVAAAPEDGALLAMAGSDEPTHGELSRRLEALEGLLMERRLTALEVGVAANSKMLWSALAGLGLLVAETFGRIFPVLLARVRVKVNG